MIYDWRLTINTLAGRFGLRREAKRHAAFEWSIKFPFSYITWLAKAVSPLRSATAIQNFRDQL
jgi:hypothetical protein